MNKKETCPDCKGEIVMNTTEAYCKRCGLVVDDSPVNDDDRTFRNGQLTNRRTGPPMKDWEVMSPSIIKW